MKLGIEIVEQHDQFWTGAVVKEIGLQLSQNYICLHVFFLIQIPVLQWQTLYDLYKFNTTRKPRVPTLWGKHF